MSAKSKHKKALSFASFFPWLLYIAACILTFYWTTHGRTFWDSYLRAVLLFNGGIQGLWTATAHLFIPGPTARSIGWQCSGFQKEIGFVNLALGITGVTSFFVLSWLVPIGLVLAIFYAGCAYVHIKERLVKNNQAPCNSGPMLYCTIWVSLTLFVTLLVESLS